MGAKAAHETPSVRDRERRMAAMSTHLRGPAGSSWFTPYRSVCGVRELPCLVIENQADGAKSGFQRMQFTQFCEDLVQLVRRIDREKFGRPDGSFGDETGVLPERGISYVQKKFTVPHTGELGERSDNKAVSETLVWDMIQHYAATEMHRFFTDLKDRRLNRHDVADAFLMAMEYAQKLYAMHARSQLPRRKRGEAFPPVMTAEQLGGGGTIQVIGIDPGFTNLGLCHMELVGQQLPPMDAGCAENVTEPLFRVLTMQLVNLHQESNYLRYTDSYSMLQWLVPTRIYSPDYTTHDIRTFFQRAQDIVDNYKNNKRSVPAGTDDAAPPPPLKRIKRESTGKVVGKNAGRKAAAPKKQKQKEASKNTILDFAAPKNDSNDAVVFYIG